jgi:hypothetical protein
MESTRAMWNPLATTWKMPRSTDFNAAGVQNYPDQVTGIEATANTLRLSHYDAIRVMLRQESFERERVRDSLNTWSGNGAYVPHLLEEWATLWAERTPALTASPTPTATLAATPTPTSRLEVVGRLPLQRFPEIAVQELDGKTYALLFSGNWLLIVNTTDPTKPFVASTVDVRGQLGPTNDYGSIAVSGAHVYVSSWIGGHVFNGTLVAVLDISDPTTPMQVGKVVVPSRRDTLYGTSEVRDLDISGDRLFAATGVGGFHIVDISDPMSPYLLGSLDTLTTVLNVAVSGSYAYITEWIGGDRGAMRVIDVAQPSAPHEVGSVSVPGRPVDIIVSDRNAYIRYESADGPRCDLGVIDISLPPRPELKATFEETRRSGCGVGLGNRLDTMAASNGYLYILHEGLLILDVNEPSAPAVVSWVNDIAGFFQWARSVALRGDKAYVGTGKGLIVFDIADPTSPQLVGSFSRPDDPTSVAIFEGYAYLGTCHDGLAVVDVSDPSSPQFIRSLYIGSCVRSIVLQGPYLYVAAFPTELLVFDLSQPALPRKVSSVDWLRHFTEIDVVVSGSYAYVVDLEALRVVHISDPLSPQVIGLIDIVGAIAVAVHDNYVYVAVTPYAVGGSYRVKDSALWVIDVSNPTSPSKIGSVQLQDASVPIRFSPRGVATNGSIAIVVGQLGVVGTCNCVNFSIVDVSEPRSPGCLEKRRCLIAIWVPLLCRTTWPT